MRPFNFRWKVKIAGLLCVLASVGCRLTAASNSISPTLDQQLKATTSPAPERDCAEFFRSFPDSFAEFARLYDYDDRTGPGPLYDNYEADIDTFFHCPAISDQEKLSKAISIGIGGKWNADAIGLFRDDTRELVMAMPVQTRNLLDTKSDREASSFWYFLIDGTHPKDAEKVNHFNKLLSVFGSDSKHGRLMKQEYKKVKKEWSEDE